MGSDESWMFLLLHMWIENLLDGFWKWVEEGEMSSRWTSHEKLFEQDIIIREKLLETDKMGEFFLYPLCF